MNLKKKLEKPYESFKERILLNVDIDLMTQSLSDFISNIHKDEINPKALNNYSHFKKGENFIAESSVNTSYYNYINETLFVHAFQTFDVFIANIFKEIYKLYPNLHRTKSKNVEDNVNSFMKEKTIISAIYRFTDFGLKLDFFKTFENELYLMAQKRHLIIHNNGRINTDFLTKLKGTNIEFKYKEGDVLKKEDLDLGKQQLVLFRIASKLQNHLIQNEIIIKTRNDSLQPV